MQLKNITIVLLLQVFTTCSIAQTASEKPAMVEMGSEKTFTNPLLNSGPDPWVIQKDGFYYYMNTEGNSLSIYKTRTLSQLRKTDKKIIYKAPESGIGSKNIWAPELHFLHNKWYLYYTAGSTADLATQRMFVMENSGPDPTQGTWILKGQIKDSSADFFAIDATVATIKSKNYLIWSGHVSASDQTQRLFIAELNADPWTLKTSRTEISTPTYDWETIGTPHVNEGPELLKNEKGKVFLIFSASGCWTDDYSLGMLTLEENSNPLMAASWTKSSRPVFTKNAENGAYGPGHNSFFKSPDGKEDWIIYHANAKPGLQCSNQRNPRMQKFTWNADGTPNFGEPVKINLPINKPSGE